MSTIQHTPFEDGHALTYTLREIDAAGCEHQSQHRDLEAAADAFVQACQIAACAELRDRTGRILAGYMRGRADTA
jgi:hypothetical protein